MKTELVFTTHVALPDSDKALAANPHTKCFREIRVSIIGTSTVFRLCSIGKEATRGGFRATPIDVREVEVPTEMFTDNNVELLGTTELGKEAWVVGNAIQEMRKEITSSGVFSSHIGKPAK